MARIRTIKPEFFRHEALFEIARKSGLPLRLAFIGLWTAADRDGRFKWRPRQLKLDVLPYDEVDFVAVLDALVSGGFVMKYVIDGDAFGVIPSWTRHQVINNREAASVLPAPLDDACLTRAGRVPDACATPLVHAQGEGEGEGEGEGKEISLRLCRRCRPERHRSCQPVSLNPSLRYTTKSCPHCRDAA